MPADLLTTEELCQAFGFARSQLYRYLAAGLPVQTRQRGRGGNLFSRQAVQDWLLAHGSANAARTVGASFSPPAASLPQVPPAAFPGPPPAPVPAPSDPSGLLALRERLDVAERLAHSQWAKAVKAHGSAAEQVVLLRQWQELSDQRRRYEKDLPRLLVAQGRYVDIDQVAALVTKAFAAALIHLDALPGACAEALLAQVRDAQAQGREATPKELRATLEAEVARARAGLARDLETLSSG